MGQHLSSSTQRWFKKMEVKVIMHGLDAAGKSTILYRLKLGEVVETNPTIGLVQETLSFRNIHIIAWDVGGRSAIRPLYRYYYTGTGAVLFVIDSNDRERVEHARDELERLLEEKEFKNAVFLVLANKQDLPGAMTVPEVAKAMDFQGILKTHSIPHSNCLSQPCNYTCFRSHQGCAVRGEGLNEAMNWLSREIETSRKIPDAKPCDPETDATSEKKTEKSPWSLSSYMKGNLESLKAFLPKLG